MIPGRKSSVRRRAYPLRNLKQIVVMHFDQTPTEDRESATEMRATL
jgi:hypothetical protein